MSIISVSFLDPKISLLATLRLRIIGLTLLYVQMLSAPPPGGCFFYHVWQNEIHTFKTNLVAILQKRLDRAIFTREFVLSGVRASITIAYYQQFLKISINILYSIFFIYRLYSLFNEIYVFINIVPFRFF